MSLATHLFRKDIHHLRMLVIVWLVVVVLETFFAATDFAYTAESRSVQWTLWWLSGLTSFLTVALVIAIVPLAVQDDSSVGTTAFWLSRPFSRWDLVAGKMSFLIAVLIIPPLIAEIVVFILYRVPLQDFAVAIPEIFLVKLAFLMPVAVLAVLTPSLPRFILVGVVTMVTIIVMVTLVTSLMIHGIQEREIVSLHVGRLPALAGLLAPSIFGGAIFVHQYSTRRTARSVLFIVLGFVLFSFSGHFGTSGAEKTHWPAVDDRIFDSGRVTVSLDPQSVSASDSFSFRAADRPQKTIAATLELAGVKPEFIVVPQYIEATLRFPDGSTTKFNRPVRPSSGGSPWKLTSLRQILDGANLFYRERYANEYAQGRSSWGILEVDAGTYDRYREKAGTLSANLRFHVSRYRLAGELPVRESARMQKNSDHVLIMRILEYPNGRRLIVRERNLELALTDVQGLNDPALFVLWNRAQSEAILPREQPLAWGTYFLGGSFQVSGEQGRFRRRLEVLDFSGEHQDGQAAVQLDSRWLSAAQLTRIEVEALGYFSKPLRVENFRMMVPAQPQLNQSAPAQ